jgi:peptidoglycan/LPS O-acetylase OafA/YrhL
MRAKYSRLLFLQNRALRIFPMLVVAVLVAAIIQQTVGSGNVNPYAVASTAFLARDLTGLPLTQGVVWTLIIEFKFYLILAVVGTITPAKLGWLYLAIAVIMLAAWAFGWQRNPTFATQLHDLHLIAFILVGASIYCAFRNEGEPLAIRIMVVIAALVSFNVIRWLAISGLGIRPMQDMSPLTQLIIIPVFIALALSREFLRGKPARFFEVASNMTYSLYLLHVSVGVLLLSALSRVWSVYPTLLVTSVIVMALSLGAHYGIEKQFMARRAEVKQR